VTKVIGCRSKGHAQSPPGGGIKPRWTCSPFCVQGSGLNHGCIYRVINDWVNLWGYALVGTFWWEVLTGGCLLFRTSLTVVNEFPFFIVSWRCKTCPLHLSVNNCRAAWVFPWNISLAKEAMTTIEDQPSDFMTSTVRSSPKTEGMQENVSSFRHDTTRPARNTTFGTQCDLCDLVWLLMMLECPFWQVVLCSSLCLHVCVNVTGAKQIEISKIITTFDNCGKLPVVKEACIRNMKCKPCPCSPKHAHCKTT